MSLNAPAISALLATDPLWLVGGDESDVQNAGSAGGTMTVNEPAGIGSGADQTDFVGWLRRYTTHNGSTGFIESNVNVVVTGAASRTYMALFKATGSTFRTLLTHGVDGATGQEVWLGMNGDGQIYLFNNPYQVRTQASFDDGGWHLAAVTIPNGVLTAGTAKIYIDGVAVATENSGTATVCNTGTGHLFVGGNFGGTNEWSGGIGLTAIYDRALSAAEVAWLNQKLTYGVLIPKKTLNQNLRLGV